MRVLFVVLLAMLPSLLLAQRQGVKGQLYWVTGNQMPGPDRNQVPRQGIAREIYVFELTHRSQTEEQDGFYKVHSRLVKRAFSKADGTFTIRLEPGRYSVFVKENKGLWANLSDAENNISPITVTRGKYVWITITIDYSAAY
ncbi:MAG: carboxypeptidase regulatory-like domain-containing protein [Cyclobacteriaceae bacterium]|jgi:hypothetical protein